ncbi:TlyA family RNA methyltransferase [Ornithinimicrobium pratense]|uniref:TlyA family RNA methyltransferase n=1 Tax=Ornithinimicrobium pratense TaxID=2593973 RepID=A0A5J6V5D0_9MICO|nr:TlyA family RNA methyltransferase [Ornithinimicrobium pratense]QFG68807.1 TlyA family RNA methyltransferase [Ornithinimicrobium pratense]
MTREAGGGEQGRLGQEPQRLDREVVRRDLARTRSQAAQLIRAGRVLVDDRVVTRAGVAVTPGQQVSLRAAAHDETSWIVRGWVGRGSLKLDHAFTAWEPEGLAVRGRRCLDVGASTGGFTQVLLERGAAHVVALDVGHNQLDPRVATDLRVTERSGTNIREVDPAQVGGPFDVVVADLSFISLTLVLPVLHTLSRPGADLVLLVKPQFEVGKERLGKDGLVRRVQDRYEVLEALEGHARTVGLAPVDLHRSPVVGGTGNVEYLWWLRRCPGGMMDCGRGPAELAARRGVLRLEEDA